METSSTLSPGIRMVTLCLLPKRKRRRCSLMLTVRQVTMPAFCGAFETLIFKLCLMNASSLSEGLYRCIPLSGSLGRGRNLTFFPKKIKKTHRNLRRETHGSMRDIQLNSCCVVQRNPACT